MNFATLEKKHACSYYELNVCVPPCSYVETLSLATQAMVLEGGVFGKR